MKCRECEFASVHTYPRNGNSNSAHVGSATVLREDGPALLPVEKER